MNTDQKRKRISALLSSVFICVHLWLLLPRSRLDDPGDERKDVRRYENCGEHSRCRYRYNRANRQASRRAARASLAFFIGDGLRDGGKQWQPRVKIHIARVLHSRKAARLDHNREK